MELPDIKKSIFMILDTLVSSKPFPSVFLQPRTPHGQVIYIKAIKV